LPSVESLRDVKFQTPLRIYSADNKLIGEYGERRTPVKLSEVSPLLIKAFIAAEDDSFYSHNGFDPMGFLRATSHYVLGIEGGGGASTLTMQVAKNSFLDDDQAQLVFKDKDDNSFLKNDGSLLYKAVQILLALKIEEGLSKEEILEIYLNQIFLGHRSYGVQAAAQTYYSKDVGQLTLAQAAVFAGMVTGPSTRNPVSYPDRALGRRNYVLHRMLELDFIDQTDFDQANAEPISARLYGTDFDLSAPYVREMARVYLEEHYGDAALGSTSHRIYKDGFRVYTTVDSRLQAAAQQAVIDGLIAYDLRHGYRGPEGHLEPVYYSAPTQVDTDEETKDAPILYPPSLTVANSNTNLIQRILKNDNETLSQPEQQLLLNSWMKELKSRPVYGGFQAAAVVKSQSTPAQAEEENEAGELIDATKHTIDVVLASGEIINIPWKNGPSEAMPYLGEDRYGYKPKDTSFLKVGDVIRVQQRRDSSWHLVQIPEAQAAFVALDPRTGAIKALVGGFDYNNSTWNRIMQAERQPGSNFKPFLYAYAMENGYSPATIINDAPVVIEYDATLETAWRPSNSGDKFFGPVPLRQALYKSINNVAVRVYNDLSRRDFINSLDRFGFDKSKFYDDGLAAALGSQVLKPIEVATAYAVFANGGYKVDNFFIDRIELEGSGIIYEADHPVVCRECEKVSAEEDLANPVDSLALDNSRDNSQEESPFDDFLIDAERVEEQLLEEAQKPKNIAPRVLDERIAFLLHDMMQDVITLGTGRRALALGRKDLAGKTATTNDNTNAWFSGYNSNIVASAWVGFDQNLSLGQLEEGGKAALPIWVDFMRVALQGLPEQNREQPPGIISVRINEKTGLRTNDPSGVFEYFLIENVPGYEDDIRTTNPIFDQNRSDPPQEIF
jgi:penicillin-binding protein 1A